MDKGLPAAVYALATLSKIHSILSLYSRATPEKTLMELNLELRHLIKEDTYITAQIVEIDSDLHTVKYAVMGHPPMIAMGMDGNSLLDRVSDSQPLNMVDDPDIAFGRFGLPPGALIALYTDGITEQHDSNDIYFGLPKLTNLLREYRHCPAQKICDLVMDRVDEFCDGIPPSDDRTIMVIKRNHS
jgi:serine phosphatase RsbU (regulator of sigma subunit)